ncbi:CpaF family protein [Candidatus Woesearchaeota archaeon]|nr:CpaF family protein [Candidatus Woesearchaeota archaeon]
MMVNRQATETFKTSATELLATPAGKERELLDKYSLETNNIVIDIKIVAIEEEPVPIYEISIANISPTTRVILEKIRQEFVSKMSIEDLQSFEKVDNISLIKKEFRKEIRILINKYFPNTDEKTINMLINYLLEENLGLGKIDILLSDPRLEEIIINNHKEPVWVYHRKFGWLKTNVVIPTEARIRHFATIIGRDIGKEITNLSPLMDAHLMSGDRVNATLMPISTMGNTITIRKFAEDPWTITKFINEGTISYEAAAIIWLAIQNELSVLITGGTGSGKTSTLNAVSNFFPPNQRMISIEDTRELTLPNNLHWVPMETRLANPEGRGGISMLDLLVNSLRMRPDRILVGEVRRKEEAEILLEAMHTGHSVYATLHANNAEETITRLTNPPIDIPKAMIASISIIMVQNRNRRTGKRRTFQIAEVTPTGDARVIMRYDPKKDIIETIAESKYMFDRITLYTGFSRKDIEFDLKQKVTILKWMVRKNITNVDDLGVKFAKYYLGSLQLD